MTMRPTLHDLPQVPAPLETLYRLGLLSKAGVGLLQFLAGIGLRFAPDGGVVHLVDWLTGTRLAANPADPLVRGLRDWASALPVQTEGFYALYLMGHGALNFLVILALFLRIRHAFAVAMTVLGGFILYQMREYVSTQDPAFLVLSAIDMIVMVVIASERIFSSKKPRMT